ncbi:CRTAC1 family protein [Halosimplex aquaticum]|uniref:CRTAC1 family protein n=1 Tax=Halosimplex aquaticum TaxID=3026162 RepID=A0ABD5Y2X7_9EURY|nr:CRTAC1 family protein [Halosimplex aquaticum]
MRALRSARDSAADSTAGRVRAPLILAVAALVVLSGCSGALGDLGGGGNDYPSEPLTFENATAEAGLNYHGSGTGVGAGNNAVYVLDYDRDGWDDLLAMGGERPVLYHNAGGEFERVASFPNLTDWHKSASVVDYDGDGWDDLLFFRKEAPPVALHNDDGTFERADVGIGNLTYPLGAAAADYDGDGDTDLFVYQSGDWHEDKPKGHFYQSGHVPNDNGNPNFLYENTGDGTFERVDAEGIRGTRWSLAASFVDFDGDGRPDIHVANDYNNDTIYLNQGDGEFSQRLLGGATARNGMASEVADVNGDGRMDVFVTNIYIPIDKQKMGEERYERLKRFLSFVIKSGRTEGNTLLINQGGGEFVDKASEYGVRHGGWGWSASLTDFDNDGRRDLIHSTQHTVKVDYEDPKWTVPQVWQRNETGFARVNKSVHGMKHQDSRGMTTLDYDNDGDRDIVLSTYEGPTVLYENTVDGGAAVQFEVVDGAGATALGANVTVSAGGEEVAVVRQTDQSDFLSQESRALHVGLGGAETATLDVTWPDGTQKSFEVDAGARYRVGPDGVEAVANLTHADDGD